MRNRKFPNKPLTFGSDMLTKTNWRITQLANGYYQTEFGDDDQWQGVTRRETIEGAEQAIDSSITHYKRKLRAAEGPVVVKTFKNAKD